LEEALLQLAAVVLFGLGEQWLACRLRLPSILLLLLIGLLLGPVLGFIDPDELLGEVLFPFVSLAVGIILFEGGLTLKLKELPVSGPIIFRLISVGALATWVTATLGSRFILGFDWSLALLVGAILIVTGPTVVGPLLRQIRPKGRAGAILKWEGILIDPVGAILAVLTFEVISLGEISNVTSFITTGVLRSLLIGLVFGLLGAGILVALLKRYLIPDYLQNGVSLMLVVGLFTLSDYLAPESGLLTVTIMGVALANQSWVSVRHILEFKENLQILLVGILFILLAGRVEISNLMQVGWEVAIFVVVLILIGRPLAVFLSTWRTPLDAKERAFLTWMAPRGIVAASVASVFAFEMIEDGHENAESLVPVIFLVIVGTVIFYGLTSGPVARRLGLAERDPQGALIIGAHSLARAIARTLIEFGFRTVLVDNNYNHISKSRAEGYETYFGDALSEDTLEDLEFRSVWSWPVIGFDRQRRSEYAVGATFPRRVWPFRTLSVAAFY
jgi:NhaP-type Na+/H+ or K+/H+ antiporter